MVEFYRNEIAGMRRSLPTPSTQRTASLRQLFLDRETDPRRRQLIGQRDRPFAGRLEGFGECRQLLELPLLNGQALPAPLCAGDIQSLVVVEDENFPVHKNIE